MEGAGNFDFDQTVILNRTMFDDKMYVKTGFTGKDLQRAIQKHGIYEERMREAEELESRQQQAMMEQFQKFMASRQENQGDGKKPAEVSV